MTTQKQFDEAVQRLLGDVKYQNLLLSGYTSPQLCREVAQDEFIGDLCNSPTKDQDVELVRKVAYRLWKGDGVTGLRNEVAESRKHKLWTVVRFPVGSWSGGGSPNDVDYAESEIYLIPAESLGQATKKAQAIRGRLIKKGAELPSQAAPYVH